MFNKKGPMETILQKATELGVSKIIPIVSERTEVRELNYNRARKIVIEATEQSNQLVPPRNYGYSKIERFFKKLSTKTRNFYSQMLIQKTI